MEKFAQIYLLVSWFLVFQQCYNLVQILLQKVIFLIEILAIFLNLRWFFMNNTFLKTSHRLRRQKSDDYIIFLQIFLKNWLFLHLLCSYLVFLTFLCLNQFKQTLGKLLENCIYKIVCNTFIDVTQFYCPNYVTIKSEFYCKFLLFATELSF